MASRAGVRNRAGALPLGRDALRPREPDAARADDAPLGRTGPLCRAGLRDRRMEAAESRTTLGSATGVRGPCHQFPYRADAREDAGGISRPYSAAALRLLYRRC